MNQDIWQYRQRLESLFKRGAALGDPEDQAHWARYLCVLTSGFVETSVQALFAQYARGQAGPHVASFVEENLRGFQSAKMNNICGLTRQFNGDWADQLEAATDGDLKDAIDSIVATRHLIAHGRDVGISFVRIKEYYERAVKVVDLLRVWCDP